MAKGGSVHLAMRRSNGCRTIDMLLSTVAQRLGRNFEDVMRFSDIFKSNWYEDERSLVDLSEEDVLKLGVPLRIVKELGIIGALGKEADDGAVTNTPPIEETPEQSNRASRSWTPVASSTAPEIPDSRACERVDAPDRQYPLEHLIYVRAKGTEHEFPWKDQILGRKAANLKHVEEATGCFIFVRGTDKRRHEDEDLHLQIAAEASASQEQFDDAIKMCEDLLDHVYQDFDDWRCASVENIGAIHISSEMSTHRREQRPRYKERWRQFGFETGQPNELSPPRPLTGKPQENLALLPDLGLVPDLEETGDEKKKTPGCFHCRGDHLAKECPIIFMDTADQLGLRSKDESKDGDFKEEEDDPQRKKRRRRKTHDHAAANVLN